jgi:hypothetical protein
MEQMVLRVQPVFPVLHKLQELQVQVELTVLLVQPELLV